MRRQFLWCFPAFGRGKTLANFLTACFASSGTTFGPFGSFLGRSVGPVESLGTFTRPVTWARSGTSVPLAQSSGPKIGGFGPCGPRWLLRCSGPTLGPDTCASTPAAPPNSGLGVMPLRRTHLPLESGRAGLLAVGGFSSHVRCRRWVGWELEGEGAGP